jgi:hypothetical protein
MDNIISNYWEGPFERKNFLEGCSSYRVIMNLYKQTKDQLSGIEYLESNIPNPAKEVTSSLGIRSISDIKKQFSQTRKSLLVLDVLKISNIEQEKTLSFAHIFMFRVWRDSLFMKKSLNQSLSS